MANETCVRELENACEAIAELASKRGQFIERSQWGEITFREIRNDIETVFWLVEETKKLPIYALPDHIAQNTTAHFSNIKNIFDEIDGFTISQGDPSSLRNDISYRLVQEIQNAMSSIGIWLPVLALRAGEIENWAAKMQETSINVTKILQEIGEYTNERRDEIDELVRAARAAAGEAGAAEFTDEFRKEAKTVEKRGKRWLWPTGIFSASALVLSVLLMLGLLGEPPTNTWDAVYRLSGRVIAISVLFYAAVWAGRIVLANMHLASVNRHRAVSLQTLQAFHKAAEDSTAKDAVVLEAARAVYENVPSGYIGRQVTGQSANARTLEVIKGVSRGSQTSDGN